MDSDDDRRKPVDRMRISHGEQLREVLDEIRNHCGGSRQAAEQLGMVHSTFNRLLTGVTRTSMSRDTYVRIRNFLKKSAITEDDGTVKFHLPYVFEDSVDDGHFGFFEHRYQEWLEAELERLEEEVGRSLILELWDLPESRTVLERHLRQAARRDDLPESHQQRQWLALYRAVEPLTKMDSTWGVERSWKEVLEAEQLGDYLRHALAAERILLEREGDLERMSLKPPPSEFFADMALAGEDDYERPEPDETLLELLDAEQSEADDDDEG